MTTRRNVGQLLRNAGRAMEHNGSDLHSMQCQCDWCKRLFPAPPLGSQYTLEVCSDGRGTPIHINVPPRYQPNAINFDGPRKAVDGDIYWQPEPLRRAVYGDIYPWGNWTPHDPFGVGTYHEPLHNPEPQIDYSAQRALFNFRSYDQQALDPLQQLRRGGPSNPWKGYGSW